MRTIHCAFALLTTLLTAQPLLAQDVKEQTELVKARFQIPEPVGTLREQGVRWNSRAWQTPFRENLSDNEKQAGLAQVWAEVKYNFAYFDRVPALDWDSLYHAYQPRVLATKSTRDYYRLLQTMMAQLQDGHTNIIPPAELSINQAKPEFSTRLVEGRVLITALQNPAIRNEGIVPGLEITQVNGEDVHAYVNRAIRPYVCSSTEQNRLVHCYDYQFLIGERGKPVELTLRDADGNTFRRKLTPTRPWYEALSNQRTFTYRMLPGNVAYVSLNYFDHESIVAKFDSIYPHLTKARGLILDVRENGGGNSQNGWDILARLTNRDFPMGQWQTRNYRPTLRAWGAKQSWHGDQYTYHITRQDTSDYFHGPVAVLTSGKTNSAAEDFLSAFVQAKRGFLVGEPTSGSTGQPLFAHLPGGGIAVICTKRDSFNDGTEWVGKGFQPDVLVRPTVADIRLGHDAVLDAALRVLEKKTETNKEQRVQANQP